ncbi:MAG: multidrug efflux SMR transporter, partial [Proteobacteria bacterium]
ILAGTFEIGFTSFMKLSEGFTKVGYGLGFVACAVASFFFLSVATRTIPLGTAYAVWTGIGAAGTALVGILFYKDPASFARVGLLALLILTVIGLKFVSAET